MNREQAESLLAQLLFDDLEEPARSQLLEYLKTDPELNEQLGDMRLTAKVLRDAMQAEAQPKLDEQHKADLQKQIENDRNRTKIKAILTHHVGNRWVAYAAMIVISALLVGVFLPALGVARRPTSRGTSASGDYALSEYTAEPHEPMQAFSMPYKSESDIAYAEDQSRVQTARKKLASQNDELSFVQQIEREHASGRGRVNLGSVNVEDLERYAGRGYTYARGAETVPESSDEFFYRSSASRGDLAAETEEVRRRRDARLSRSSTVNQTEEDGRGSLVGGYVLGRETTGLGTRSELDMLSNSDYTESTGKPMGGVAGGYGGAFGGYDIKAGTEVRALNEAPKSNATPATAGEPITDYFGDKWYADESSTSRFGTVNSRNFVSDLEPAAEQSGADQGGLVASDLSAPTYDRWLASNYGLPGSQVDTLERLPQQRVELLGETPASMDAFVTGPSPSTVAAARTPAPAQDNLWAAGRLGVAPAASATSTTELSGEAVSLNEADRETMVQEKLRMALDLQREQNYDQALDVLKEAEFLKPNDVAANAITEMVEEARIATNARDVYRRRDQGIARQKDTEDASIPEGEVQVLNYPADWPQITMGRLQADVPDAAGFDARVVEAVPELVNKGVEKVPVNKQKVEVDIEPLDAMEGVTVLGDQPMPAEEAPLARKPRLMPVNPWVMTADDRLSTFALDVDTASYSIARRYIHDGFLPPKYTVRMEEFVNNFDYNYPAGQGDSEAFTVHAEAGPSPFGQGTVLVKIGVRGKVVGRDQAKPANLVFVVDTSGSMDRDDRLPLVRKSLVMVLDQLSPQDRVSIVSYGTKANLLIEAAPASDKQRILDSLENLQTGGSTNLLSGVELGYEVAQRQFMTNGVNRVILNSDGVANVGPSESDELIDQVQTLRRQGVSFTSVGFGAGNYDDKILEQLANKGDGDYLFVGSIDEAKRLFVDDLAATRPIIAYDAKIQVDFDPARVRRYRLIGYENRDIADKDFRNDTVDAGEVGSGQSATALYEVELLGPMYATQNEPDLGTVYVRYRDPDTQQVREIESRLTNDLVTNRIPSEDERFYLAACAARFAEVLRGSEHVQEPEAIRNLAQLEIVLDVVASRLPMDQSVQDFSDLVHRAIGLPQAQ